MELKKETKFSSIIEECYSLCPRTQKLHNDYSNFTIKECIKDIEDKMKEVESTTFYSVHKDKSLIGYIITANIPQFDCLFSFFIKPEFRTKPVLTEYWETINSLFNKSFISGVYSSNKPAIRFLSKNSDEIYKINNQTFFLYRK